MPVNVEGLNETRRALKKFAPDLYKQMNKEIAVALKVIVKVSIGKLQQNTSVI